MLNSISFALRNMRQSIISHEISMCMYGKWHEKVWIADQALDHSDLLLDILIVDYEQYV